jgi:GxxExxY protein
MGPGLLESTYAACFAHELKTRGLRFTAQAPISVEYKDLLVEHAFRADFVVDNCLIVELKAVDELSPLHVAQTLNYLKLSGLRVGLIFNFGARNLRQGMRRVIL